MPEADDRRLRPVQLLLANSAVKQSVPEAEQPKARPCIEAVKKLYAVSDAVYDVTNSELIGEDRTPILSLLTEARNLALDCGCNELADGIDQLRIEVVKQPKVDHIREEVDKLKKTAKECLKKKAPARPAPPTAPPTAPPA